MPNYLKCEMPNYLKCENTYSRSSLREVGGPEIMLVGWRMLQITQESVIRNVRAYTSQITVCYPFISPWVYKSPPLKYNMYGLSFASLFPDTNMFQFFIIFPLLAFASTKELYLFILSCDWNIWFIMLLLLEALPFW